MWIEVVSGLDAGRAVEIGAEPVTVGTGPGCTLVLSDPDVAPLHASLRRGADGAVELHRLDDARAPTVDGEEVSEPRTVGAGQAIVVGDVELALREQAPSDPDRELDPALAAAIGSDGPHADEELPLGREHRRVSRVALLAGGALALAAVVGILAVAGVFGGDDGPDVAAIVHDAEPSTVKVVARDAGQEASGTG